MIHNSSQWFSGKKGLSGADSRRFSWSLHVFFLHSITNLQHSSPFKYRGKLQYSTILPFSFAISFSGCQFFSLCFPCVLVIFPNSLCFPYRDFFGAIFPDFPVLWSPYSWSLCHRACVTEPVSGSQAVTCVGVSPAHSSPVELILIETRWMHTQWMRTQVWDTTDLFYRQAHTGRKSFIASGTQCPTLSRQLHWNTGMWTIRKGNV